jgi:6-pyruvoyltetrahydropterin/6-carboxytetrahydropterin synthase
MTRVPRITRSFGFDAGHRVLEHESKCRYLHGHRYTAEVTVTARQLDDLGRVVDFGVLKELVGNWIDARWDHNLILNPEDPFAQGLEFHRAHGRSPFIMPDEYPNPTAENMVQVLANVVGPLIEPYGLTLDSIRLYETPNCWADWKA